MTYPAKELHGVLLERHPSPATEAEPAPSEGRGHVRGGDLDACRQAFEHSNQSRPMGFTGSQPTQHGEILPQRRRRTRQMVKTWTGNIRATHAPRIIDGPKAIDDERLVRLRRSRISR